MILTVVGVTGGAVLGVLGAAGLAVGGALSGATQIVRGILAAPEGLAAPLQGKWWSEADGKWVLTNMQDEAKALEGIPESDSDILGKIEAELDQSAAEAKGDGTVKDMFYYDALEVPADAEASVIKRRYYILARKYHPDKVGDDKEAAEKFKVVAEAYQVLSDPTLRAKYDKEGREGLSPDKTSVAEGVPKIDPQILFSFLFGSDQFYDLIGRLSTASAARVGDSPKVSIEDAHKLQKRREVRIALKLIEKITPWTKASPDERSTIEQGWKDEGIALSNASYGYQLVTTIGKLYNLLATMNQGSFDNSHSLPCLSKWAARNKAVMEKKSDASRNQMETMKAGFAMLHLQADLKKKLDAATSDEEKEAIAKEMEGNAMGIMLRVLWSTLVVDISSTLYETAQMVFFDQSVDKEEQKLRAAAVKQLGAIWMELPEPVNADNEEVKDARKLYEEAAFAAMVETMKKKDEAAFGTPQ